MSVLLKIGKRQKGISKKIQENGKFRNFLTFSLKFGWKSETKFSGTRVYTAVPGGAAAPCQHTSTKYLPWCVHTHYGGCCRAALLNFVLEYRPGVLPCRCTKYFYKFSTTVCTHAVRGARVVPCRSTKFSSMVCVHTHCST